MSEAESGMMRFFKRQRVDRVEDFELCETSEQHESDDIVSDPALRKPMSEFDARIRDRIRREYIAKGPCQPTDHAFPKKHSGQCSRSFRSAWFKQFDWLEYSVTKDAAFCFVCYLFRPTDETRGDEVFIKAGFTNWKKVVQKFKERVGNVGSLHNDVRILMDGFKNQRQSVSQLLEAQTLEQQVDYRTRLTASLDVIRLLSRQGLPFRGHDESSTSSNKGHFLEVLDWYGERCPDVFRVIGDNAPANNLMTSPEIQKDIVKACAIETTRVILNEIGDKLFTLLVDESRDVSVKEQMVVVLRYISDSGAVIERFLAIVHVSETSAKCLKAAIDSLFATHGLSISRLRGQVYDGASNMRGKFHGLKALILQKNPSAMYVHCFAHQLQLVVVATARANRHISDFFAILVLIVNAAGSSCKRRDQLRQIEHDRLIKLLETGEALSGSGKNQETNLCRPGDTRWGSHYLTMIRLSTMWPSVIEVLHNVYDDGSEDTRGLSLSLVKKMETYKFVFILHLMLHILGLTNNLSKSLQLRDQNIVQVVSLIQTLKDKVQEFRETGWDSFLKKVETFCVAHSIDVVNMNDMVRSRGRMRRDGEVVTFYQLYRVEIFCEVVDLLAQEMENRFPESSTELLSCISCLDPRDCFSSFDEEKLLRLSELYPNDFSSADHVELSNEFGNYIHNVRRDDQFLHLRDLESLSKKMIETRKATSFPFVHRLLELALLLPVATASVLRAFSAMKLVKTDLRNKMGDEWLNNSLVVYIERNVFSSIDNERILNTFQNMATRKYQLSSHGIGSSGLISVNSNQFSK